MVNENTKSIHIANETHELLIKKRNEIYEKTKISMKLADLADIILKNNIEKFTPEMIALSQIKGIINFSIKKLANKIGRIPNQCEINEYYKNEKKEKVDELKLTENEKIIYELWKSGTLNKEVEKQCIIWYTNISGAPHEDRWNHIKEMTLEEVKDKLKDGFEEENLDIFKEGEQRLIGIRLPEINHMDENNKYEGTEMPEIYFPLILLDELDEFKIKDKIINSINNIYKKIYQV